MTEACPVPTPAEQKYSEIKSRIEQAMMRKVLTALEEAAERARAEMQAADLKMPPPSTDYLTAVIHQKMYCALCKADPETFLGGDADIAVAVIRNNQNIAMHYWGAEIQPHSRT